MHLPGGPTKDEIMAISLFKLGLRKSDIFADIGCGTGKISLHAAPFVKKVYAADIREEAVWYTRNELNAAGLTNIEISHEDGFELLNRLERIDAAFVGGSKRLPEVLELLADRRARSIVVNAVKLNTVNTAVTEMQRLNIFHEAILVSVAHSSPLAGGIMFRPIDPVFIIVGGSGCL